GHVSLELHKTSGALPAEAEMTSHRSVSATCSDELEAHIRHVRGTEIHNAGSLSLKLDTYAAVQGRRRADDRRNRIASDRTTGQRNCKNRNHPLTGHEHDLLRLSGRCRRIGLMPATQVHP